MSKPHIEYVRGHRSIDPAAFWSRINFSGAVHPIHGQCWEWTGHTDLDGYGMLKVSGVSMKCSRHSWNLEFGDVPNGLCVLHHCDNRLCIRPAHLFLGTNLDNSLDMMAKSRQAHGEGHGCSKLLADQVRWIRQVHSRKHPQYSAKALGKLFDVSGTQITNIVRGKAWRLLEQGGVA